MVTFDVGVIGFSLVVLYFLGFHLHKWLTGKAKAPPASPSSAPSPPGTSSTKPQ